MAMVSADAPREAKQEWLMRPFDWAYNVSFFGAFFGFVYWYLGEFEAKYLVLPLCAALAAIFVLLLWGFKRLDVATRGR